MPGKTGNKNALRHGLYSKQPRTSDAPPADISKTIVILEGVLDKLAARLDHVGDENAYAKTAAALASCATAIFTGHRTIAFLSGKVVPIGLALQELAALDLDQD